jgi:arylsulfatase
MLCALGRVVEACKQLPDADNTLIIYIAGDKGASAEGGLKGLLCENMFFNDFSEKWQDNTKAIDELGGPKHFNPTHPTADSPVHRPCDGDGRRCAIW